MGTSTGVQNRESPEQRVVRLAAQLRNHTLWDSLLIFSPPLLVAIYLAVYLYQAAWITSIALLLFSGLVITMGLLAVVLRTRPLVPSVGSAARLVDEKAEAKDRFLTLATLDVGLWSTELVGRLRGEASALLERIDFRREFPYRIKRSFYWSLVGSLVAAVLFHFSIPRVESSLRPVSPAASIRELAEKMTQRPALLGLAHDLKNLAMKLQQPDLSGQQMQALIHEVQEQVEKQQKTEKEKESQALLGEAASTLQGLEQEFRNQKGDSEKGDGGGQGSLSQERQGEGKQSQGGGGESKGELKAQRSQDMHQGQGAGSDAKEQGQEKGQQSQADVKGNEPGSSKADKDAAKEMTGKTQAGAQEKLGKSRSEETPQGAPPAERFYKPGEQGKEGVKGARYVNVQLPEELAADSKGEGTITKQAKEAKAYPKEPVSNVPLPAHVPDAPTEKQQLPLEYRGIIR